MVKDENNTQKASVEQKSQKAVSKEYDLSKNTSVIAMFSDKLSDDEIKNHLIKYLEGLITKYKLWNYNIFLLYDEHTSLAKYESNAIYKAVSNVKEKKDILLILNSGGGKIEPAYLISKMCKKLSKERFVVAIPRRAKSAATLLAIGADEIHMGIMSELGPIDPQIGGYPALVLGNALNLLAKMASDFPSSSEMFARYLTRKLNLKDLGFFERVTESAAQYAERLLQNKKLPSAETAKSVAHKLVYHYKDHGFVIDIDEISSILSNDTIKENTTEYKFSNDAYNCLSLLDFLYDFIRKKTFTYVGEIKDGLSLRDKPKED